MVGHLVKGLSKSNFANLGEKSEEDKRWLEYNYPPGLKLIYYSRENLREPINRYVGTLHLSVLIIAFVQILSCK